MIPRSNPVSDLNTEIRSTIDDIRRMRQEIADLQHALDQAKGDLAELTRTRASELLVTQANPVKPGDKATGKRDQIRRPIRWVKAMSARPEWNPAHSLRWDIIALVLIVTIAAATRFIDLTSSPPGMQGDEAAVGLEARHILNDGWIGLYSPAAAGTPTGYYYMAAPFVAIWGDTILAVRLLSATLGTLTVISVYLLFRRNLGFPSAVIGTGLFAIFGWNLIFSRLSLLTISWPFLAISGLVLLFEGIRSCRWEWWFGSGVVLALGLYTYNGQSLFVLLIGAFIAWQLFGWRALIFVATAGIFYVHPDWLTAAALLGGLTVLAFARSIRLRSNLEQATGFAIGFGIAAFPMAKWILGHDELYFGRGRRLSVFKSDSWLALDSTRDQVRFIWDRYVEFWNLLSFAPRPDAVDTSGVVAIVPQAMLVLLIAGILISLVVRNNPLTRLGIITILIMPIATISFTDFAMRRALIAAPFIVMFCAIAVVEIIRFTWTRSPLIKYGALIGTAALLGWVSWQNIDGYYVGTNQSRHVERVLAPDLLVTIDYMNTLPDGSYVYFGSNRWPIGMEIIRFLGPDIVGETRFEPYGPDTTDIDLTKGRPVWILMGPNQALLPEITGLYPGGEMVTSDFTTGTDQKPAFIAYFPPVSP